MNEYISKLFVMGGMYIQYLEIETNLDNLHRIGDLQYSSQRNRLEGFFYPIDNDQSAIAFTGVLEVNKKVTFGRSRLLNISIYTKCLVDECS